MSQTPEWDHLHSKVVRGCRQEVGRKCSRDHLLPPGLCTGIWPPAVRSWRAKRKYRIQVGWRYYMQQRTQWLWSLSHWGIFQQQTFHLQSPYWFAATEENTRGGNSTFNNQTSIHKRIFLLCSSLFLLNCPPQSGTGWNSDERKRWMFGTIVNTDLWSGRQRDIWSSVTNQNVHVRFGASRMIWVCFFLMFSKNVLWKVQYLHTVTFRTFWMWWQNQNTEVCHFEVIWLVCLSGCHWHSSFLFLSVRSQFTFPFLISLLQLPLALPSIIVTPLAVLLRPPCFSPSLPSSVPHSLIPSGSDIFLHLETGCATQMCFLKKKLKLGQPTPALQTQPPAVIQSLAFEISSCPDLTALYRLLFGVYSRNHLDPFNRMKPTQLNWGDRRGYPVSTCQWRSAVSVVLGVGQRPAPARSCNAEDCRKSRAGSQALTPTWQHRFPASRQRYRV